MDVGNDKERDVVNLPEVQDPKTELCNDIYFRDVTSKQLKYSEILAVINDISLALNSQVLGVLPRDEVVYGALDKISDDPEDKLTYHEEILNSLTPTGTPLHKLDLKIN